MFLPSLSLFLFAFGTGFFAVSFPDVNRRYFRYSLIFSGAYLFALTIVHILPDVFILNGSSPKIGLFVLFGFFMQLILEYFTSGVEHGHLHGRQNQNHHHSLATPLMIALCLHAFLEGTLLTREYQLHPEVSSSQVLFGIVAHKMPVAFALMSILVCQFKGRTIPLLLLMGFSLATPAGIYFTAGLELEGLVSPQVFQAAFAIVAGNFLYISTTIFYESSPGHRFQGAKLAMSLMGAGLAVFLEWFVRGFH